MLCGVMPTICADIWGMREGLRLTTNTISYFCLQNSYTTFQVLIFNH